MAGRQVVTGGDPKKVGLFGCRSPCVADTSLPPGRMMRGLVIQEHSKRILVNRTHGLHRPVEDGRSVVQLSVAKGGVGVIAGTGIG
jgi:hypothetical protein